MNSSKKEPKIVLWDIETSGIVATTWNLYPESIHHSNMLQDWFIICAAWKELGKEEIKAVSVLDHKGRFKKDHTDDFHVISTLRKMLEDVDILIHHNGDKFDLKAFNTRLIMHNLPPLPPIVTIDTLKAIKKVAKFTSNRLDFLGQTFTGKGKMETPSGTWLKAMKGDTSAIQLMVDYNKVDVQVLEDVYTKIRPYIKTPHMGVLQGEHKDLACENCGSLDLIRKMKRITASGVMKQQYQCKTCGKYHTTHIDK